MADAEIIAAKHKGLQARKGAGNYGPSGRKASSARTRAARLKTRLCLRQILRSISPREEANSDLELCLSLCPKRLEAVKATVAKVASNRRRLML